MSFDPLVANPGRLKILTALAVEERQEFVDLRRRTELTDGNLAAHAKRLHGGGLIEIDKQFKDGKPVTTFVLTGDGRRALEAHARRLMSALSQRRVPAPAQSGSDAPASPVATTARRRTPRPKPSPDFTPTTAEPSPATAAAAPVYTSDDRDDWVD